MIVSYTSPKPFFHKVVVFKAFITFLKIKGFSF